MDIPKMTEARVMPIQDADERFVNFTSVLFSTRGKVHSAKRDIVHGILSPECSKKRKHSITAEITKIMMQPRSLPL